MMSCPATYFFDDTNENRNEVVGMKLDKIPYGLMQSTTWSSPKPIMLMLIDGVCVALLLDQNNHTQERRRDDFMKGLFIS